MKEPDMADSEREYLRIPRDADFPTLPVPTDFQDYAHAYFIGAKELWEKTGKDRHMGVPWPDNLVYPILFLVHHFLELELKSAIELTHSIGKMTGEITVEPDLRGHDLDHLLSLTNASLAKLDGIPGGRPTEPTCELIEDMAKFGVFGESLRYPITTVNEKKRKKVIGTNWPSSFIPDVATVIEAAEKAWVDFRRLISYLIEYEDYLYASQR